MSLVVLISTRYNYYDDRVDQIDNNSSAIKAFVSLPRNTRGDHLVRAAGNGDHKHGVCVPDKISRT